MKKPKKPDQPVIFELPKHGIELLQSLPPEKKKRRARAKKGTFTYLKDL